MAEPSKRQSVAGCVGCVVFLLPGLLWLANVIGEDLTQRYYIPIFMFIWSVVWSPWVGWILSVVLLVVVLVSRSGYQARLVEAQRAKQSAGAMVRLYDVAFRSADNLVSTSQKGDPARDLVKAILAETGTVFGGSIMRSSVFLEDGDVLSLFVSHHMPDEYTREFYIGEDKRQRPGVAGRAFKTSQVQVARRIPTEPGEPVQFDHPDYFPLDPKEGVPQYNVFIAVPIITEEGYTVGVLCLDSQDWKVFDAESTQGIAVSIGHLIATTIEMALRLQHQATQLKELSSSGSED